MGGFTRGNFTYIIGKANLKPGWLKEEIKRVEEEVKDWPDSLRRLLNDKKTEETTEKAGMETSKVADR